MVKISPWVILLSINWKCWICRPARCCICSAHAQGYRSRDRNFLGGFDFHNDKALDPIQDFSGGEKARLALALIVWQKPNLLLLDEPTNHLDLEMRHALTMALQSYEGALVVISHDRHLLRNTVDDFYLVASGRVTEFDGDLNDYQDWLKNFSRENTQAHSVSCRKSCR
jgi:ATP-binding cassette subfamily F protein 3